MIEANSIHLLSNLKQGEAVARILQTALAAADPIQAVRRALHVQDKRLITPRVVYDLSTYRRVHLLSLGKAGGTMSWALDELFGGFVARGLVVVKTADQTHPSRFPLIEGAHPVPDERSLAAGRAVRAFLGEIDPDDFLICAISGGGSSLVAAPREPLKLVDLQTLTKCLLACGATIDEINTLRRHLDVLKGGGFLLQTRATILSLILSDVIGNSLAAIASGPTAPDPSTREDALQIVGKYNLLDQISGDIFNILEHAPETLKPGHPRFENVQNILIGSNQMSIQAALSQAAAEGFHTLLLRADLGGEARTAARELCRALREIALPRPFCLIAGGETIVTLNKPLDGAQGGPFDDAQGGRNTELALAAVPELAGLPDVLLVALATDGEDGPTDAAGAVVSGETWQRAQALGLDPAAALRRHASYTFFSALGDLLKTGPTGTNVNDLVFLFGF